MMRTKISDIREALTLFQSSAAATINNWQVRLSMLEHDYQVMALSFYAYGYSLDLVHRALACSALAALKVFERRGTEPPFPWIDVTIDERYPQGDPRHVIQTPRHPPGTKDHSLTNARATVWSVCEALAGGEFGLASHLASLAWNHPDDISELCTANHQHLASALKHFFADDLAGMQAELKRIHSRPRKGVELGYIGGMLDAITINNDVQFREWLGDLLDSHERQAKDENVLFLNSELCLPGVAFTALAVKRGVIPVSQLPQNNVYLPIELINLAQTGERGESQLEFDPFESLVIDTELGV